VSRLARLSRRSRLVWACKPGEEPGRCGVDAPARRAPAVQRRVRHQGRQMAARARPRVWRARDRRQRCTSDRVSRLRDRDGRAT